MATWPQELQSDRRGFPQSWSEWRKGSTMKKVAKGPGPTAKKMMFYVIIWKST